MTQIETHRAVEAVWRIEAARLIGSLTKLTRDVGQAEELAQDALVAALRDWPQNGIPNNAGAWLMQTAKRRFIDHFRRSKVLARSLPELAYGEELRQEDAPDLDARLDDDVKDNVLSLIFTACHPVLGPEARAALTLRLVGGLSTAEIARAYLAAEPTIQQRIVRAKKTLADAHVPFEVPRGEERLQRLGSVLEVVYLIFNEGYSATAGDDWMRTELCDEALRVGRILAQLMPDEAEVHGLLALMEIQASRAAARVKADGTPILLLEQDRTRWNQILIRRGLAALARAIELDGAMGPYTLQAAIAACHARARKAADTDWRQIAALYDELALVTPSPVIELNRAVAHCMAHGPEAGLRLLEPLQELPAMRNYHLLPSVRGDFLTRLGRHDEARVEFRRAAELTGNARERELLLKRAAGQG
ncbi:MAG: RNA polymerase subunit sigma-24 [Devosia sp. 67-54]|mgnify:CR=1 FL=1|uniref:RNA polymerase sigma factor n=1 Tax=unclassified Devosia TaxID=196773 RepID=UPI00095DC77A|nr:MULTISPECIES: RNA polymerase sigma factor [unclassified Devosia]MBN9306262.1 RNA polymerase sigma factor [Devosia sp.]OJX18336.1 MAG: RNA polymerase subunit sigma-24 [Devosia sp. 67-54]